MLHLRLRALRIVVATNDGHFGFEETFDAGLNVLRAENTSGKSTVLGSILYALGLEIVLGRHGTAAIKPALKSILEYEGRTYNVLESYVELEIANRESRAITLRRYVTGAVDQHVVSVTVGKAITEPTRGLGRQTDYFVGISGSAQMERGFHYFLADFLTLELPAVQKYNGEEGLLYFECIMPLAFIEQVRGWSGIQATTPKMYGIQNVSKVAIEYLLQLDVSHIVRERQALRARKHEVNARWQALGTYLGDLAEQAHGILTNYPPNPTAGFQLEEQIGIAVPLEDGDWINLNPFLVMLREEVGRLSTELQSSSPLPQALEEDLERLENERLLRQAALADVRKTLAGEEGTLSDLKQRLVFIETDIKKNQDVVRLQKYGAEQDLGISQGTCPTCWQPLSGALVEHTVPPMRIQDNIKFLEQQKHAVVLLTDNVSSNIVALRAQYEATKGLVWELKRKIRDLRKSLIGTEGPATARVRNVVRLEKDLEDLESVRDRLDRKREEVKSLMDEWLIILNRERELAGDIFSPEDREKLRVLRTLFARNVSDYGFRSTVSVDEIDISEDTYRPTLEGFEIVYDASASDNIRVIWAYTLALLQLSQQYDTKHPGLAVFDEPGQQQISHAARVAFFRSIRGLDPAKSQVIVATSEDPESVKAILSGISHKMMEYGTKTLRPLRGNVTEGQTEAT